MFFLYNGVMGGDDDVNGAALMGPAQPPVKRAGVRLTPEKKLYSNIFSSA